MFNPLTKEKAWRSWRLLIMDGHGSYVTPQFLSFCARERVLVLIYPPHSTQTLQPLDVVCFSPFAGNYSKALTEHLHASQGLEPFKKGDFFLLFWRAWVETFTEALILRSFEAVGIALLNPDVILRRFNKSTPEAEAATSLEVNDVDNNWRESDRVWRRSVRDPSSTEALQLRQTLHHLSNQNELLKIERENLQAALAAANQKPEKGKPLPLIQRRETQAKAQWWSPRAVNKAQHLQDIFNQEKRDKKLQKQTAKELRHSNKLLKQKLEAEKRAAAATRREEAAERRRVKEQDKAKQRAERERQKRNKINARKSI